MELTWGQFHRKMKDILEMSLKIANSTSQPHLPGGNENIPLKYTLKGYNKKRFW